MNQIPSINTDAQTSQQAGWIRKLAGLTVLLLVTACSSSSPEPASPKTGPGAAGAKPVPATPASKNPNTAVVPKSSFHVDPATARDPFFPGASRAVAQAQSSVPIARLPLISYLKLGGIWPGKTRPLALINTTTLAPGEERDISIVVSNQLSQAEVQKVNVRCLEVRQDSVLISIDGEQGVKELHIAQGK
jgi:hypothetical protein